MRNNENGDITSRIVNRSRDHDAHNQKTHASNNANAARNHHLGNRSRIRNTKHGHLEHRETHHKARHNDPHNHRTRRDTHVGDTSQRPA